MAWLGRTSKKEYCPGVGRKKKPLSSKWKWANTRNLTLIECPWCGKFLRKTKTGKVRSHRVG